MNNKKINLVELLKGREGINLWSPIMGKCILKRCEERKNDPYAITVAWVNDNNINCEIYFTSEGCYTVTDNAYCVLFPSENAYRNNSGWEGFKSRKLIIANALDYKPMLNWIKGIDNITEEKRKLLQDLTGLKYEFYLSSYAYYISPVTGEPRSNEIYIISKGAMTEFIPVFKEI